MLILKKKARGVGFEPTCPCEHGISNPTPYQARRSPHTSAHFNWYFKMVFKMFENENDLVLRYEYNYLVP